MHVRVLLGGFESSWNVRACSPPSMNCMNICASFLNWNPMSILIWGMSCIASHLFSECTAFLASVLLPKRGPEPTARLELPFDSQVAKCSRCPNILLSCNKYMSRLQLERAVDGTWLQATRVSLWFSMGLSIDDQEKLDAAPGWIRL